MLMRTVTAALAGCALVSLAQAQNGERADAAIISQTQLNALVAEFPMFSGGVIVAEGGGVAAQKYVGFANRESKLKNDEQTLFSVASIGKMFTAVGIVQLVEAGKIEYETAVIDVIPELGENISDSVSIDHLLHHKSGISRISGVDDETLDSLHSNSDYFGLILSTGAGSTGTADFAYRNENFQLLGEIIARVSGQSYESYIQEHIAQPARMNGPVFERESEAGTQTSANNYLAVDFETWWNSEESIVANNAEEFVHLAPRSTPSAGGGGYATAMDMMRFADALRSGTLISEKGFREMCELPREASENGRGYGRGCSVSVGEQGTRIGHTGSTAGIQARFYLYLEQGVDVVVLSNHDEQAAPLFREIDRLIRGADNTRQ